ncbi:MAG: AbrB/MazE/SpoVT family DNA-binding domain-containing protein [Cytophagales bacterium]|nr:AbrB/MazE/SpoVT family DNA-binding domain-containing protein [Cytophagales bacterium]
MNTVIQKVGNNFAVLIPKKLAKTSHLNEGMKVNLTLKNNEIIINKDKQSKYTLDQLLSKVNKDNLHKEISFGKPVGKEII